MTHNSRSTLFVRAFTTVAACCAMIGAIGCTGDTGYNPVLSERELFAQMALSEHAVNLATDASFNTLQLHAAPTFADGSVVPGTVAFTTTSDAITVSSTGVITAQSATLSPAIVRASMTYGGVTRSDSVYVNVIDGGPSDVVHSLSIQPADGDSAKVATNAAVFNQKVLNLQILSASNTPISGLVVTFRSSDTLTATVDANGTVSGLRPGQVTLYASTYAYGVTVQDSLRFTIGQPLGVFIGIPSYIPTGSSTPRLEFVPKTITIGVGGNVVWLNNYTIPIDMVFDDTAGVEAATDILYLDGHPGSGNIPAFQTENDESGFPIFGSSSVVRSFMKPGTYRYHSTFYDHPEGTIIVCDERTTLCPR